MPHSYDAAFLKSLQHQTQKYSDRLDKCVQDLEEHSGDSAVSVTEAGQECVNMLKQQQEAWQQVLGTNKGGAENTVSASNLHCNMQNQAVDEGQIRSAKPECGCRVAAMGGTPALGAGMVLPKLSPHQLQSLSNTESPAARELHAAQGRCDEVASASPPPSVNTPNSSPPWLIELRKRQGNSRPSSPPKQ